MKEAYKIESARSHRWCSAPRTPRKGPTAFAEKRDSEVAEQMTLDPRSPCIIGVAREMVRPGRGSRRGAARDVGAGVPGRWPMRHGAGELLDVPTACRSCTAISWQYDDPPGRLAEPLGIAPKHRYYSGIGGTTPQVLVQDAAEAIVAGDHRARGLCRRRGARHRPPAEEGGREPQWSHSDPERKPFPFEAPFHPAEIAHEVFQAWHTFAICDIARRAISASRPTSTAARSASCSRR